MVRTRGLEPPRREAPDPKSGVYTNFTTSAQITVKIRDNLIKKILITNTYKHIYFKEINSFSATVTSINKNSYQRQSFS